MPYIYEFAPGSNFATSATPNTEVDAMFLAPGAGRMTQLIAAAMVGKGAQLTSLSGIVQRLKQYTSTASSGGSAVTGRPRDSDSPAAKTTCGQASAGVTPGTGGPIIKGIFGSSASAPGPGWNTLNNPDAAIVLEAAATQSIDFLNSSGTASLNFETSATVQE